MSLSAGTLLAFLLLIPGVIFRAALYQNSVVVRPFFSAGTVPAIVAVLFYSSAIYAICFGFFSILGYFLPGPQLAFSIEFGVVVRKLGEPDIPVREYFLTRPLWGLAVLIGICALSIYCAVLIQYFSIHILALGRLMHGPLARVLYKRKVDHIVCAILTPHIDNGVAILYQGVPIEVSLNDTNSINHVVLKSARRFNVAVEHDECKVSDARPYNLSSSDTSNHHDILFVDGSQIFNVHFDYFSVRAISYRDAREIMARRRLDRR